MTDLARKPANTLASVEEASRILAECRTVDEAKEIYDKAEAIKVYLRKQKTSKTAAIDASEISLRAARRVGELLKTMPKLNGAVAKYTGLQHATPLGIEKTQSHRFQVIASVPDDAIENHIRLARKRDEEITISGVLKLAKKSDALRTVEQPQPEITGSHSSLETIGDKFGCIYADPPWSYDNQATRSATDGEYPTMSVDDICALPIEQYALDDCHLHLWTTNAFLHDSFRVMEAWGFTYKSVLIWCKPSIGIGNYWRVSHEFLMLGVRGSAPFRDHGIISWHEKPRSEKHSEKPYYFRGLIEKVSPGPYLELFSRRATPGWTVFGNQIEHDLYTQEYQCP